MILIFLFFVVLSLLLMLGEVFYEHDWPRDTFPCLLWSMFFLLLWIVVI